MKTSFPLCQCISDILLSDTFTGMKVYLHGKKYSRKSGLVVFGKEHLTLSVNYYPIFFT